MITVRPAVEADLPSLLELGAAMLAESPARFPALESDRVARQLSLTLAHPEMMMAALAADRGETLGMVTAVAGDYAFSTERRASCDLLFVRPERRGIVAARMLVRYFEQWAASVGAKTAIMGISTGVHPERTGELFKHLGFEVMGITYRKAIG